MRRTSVVPASLVAIASAYDCSSCGRSLTHLSVVARGRHVHNCLAAKDDKEKLDGWLGSAHQPQAASVSNASTLNGSMKRNNGDREQEDEWEIWPSDAAEADGAIVLDQDGEEEEDDDEREETLLRRLSQSQDDDKDCTHSSDSFTDGGMGCNATAASQCSTGSYSLGPRPVASPPDLPAGSLIPQTVNFGSTDCVHETRVAIAARVPIPLQATGAAAAAAAAAQWTSSGNAQHHSTVDVDGNDSNITEAQAIPVAVEPLRDAADIDTRRFLDANVANVDAATFFGLPKSVQGELVCDWKWKQSKLGFSRSSPRGVSRREQVSGGGKRRGPKVQASVTAFFRRNRQDSCE